jgi:hypothetical protein
MGPVVIVADAVLQEEPIPDADRRTLRVPKLNLATPPAGDSGAIAEAAPAGGRREPRRLRGLLTQSAPALCRQPPVRRRPTQACV